MRKTHEACVVEQVRGGGGDGGTLLHFTRDVDVC